MVALAALTGDHACLYVHISPRMGRLGNAKRLIDFHAASSTAEAAVELVVQNTRTQLLQSKSLKHRANMGEQGPCFQGTKKAQLQPTSPKRPATT